MNSTLAPAIPYMLNFQSVSLGGQEIGRPLGGGGPVIMRTSFISAPKDAVDAVVKATGAEYDFRTDTFQVDCDSRSSMPDLIFKDKALEYRVPANDYARKLNAGDKKCTLMISDIKRDTDDWYDWYLGTSFFRSYCQLLDYATETFSLAKVLR
ncbi:CBN-ASP-1 protein [Aphelenchoides avenae]|nr:CBN-ASP-1 protein [Aphelenchus avenae]